MPYFTELARQEDPGKEQLHEFMDAARRFLLDLLNNQLQLDHPRPADAPPLFLELREEALAVFREYVYARFEQLHNELDRVSLAALRSSGLTGRPQYLKLRALAELEKSPDDAAAYWSRVGKMHQQVDAMLDSILDLPKIAAPSVDIQNFLGLFKQFRSTVFSMVNG